jgi:hypothetical protein
MPGFLEVATMLAMAERRAQPTADRPAKIESPWTMLVGLACPVHHPARPGTRYVNADGLTERNRPGCFNTTVLQGDFCHVQLIDHAKGREKVCSRTDGTLELWEDDQGLRFRALLPPGSEALATIRRLGLWQVSIAGHPKRIEVTNTMFGRTRTVGLWLVRHLALVRGPAYAETWVSDELWPAERARAWQWRIQGEFLRDLETVPWVLPDGT